MSTKCTSNIGGRWFRWRWIQCFCGRGGDSYKGEGQSGSQCGRTQKLIVEGDLGDWQRMLMWAKWDRCGGAELWMAFIVWRRMLLPVFNWKPVQSV